MSRFIRFLWVASLAIFFPTTIAKREWGLFDVITIYWNSFVCIRLPEWKT